MRRRSYTKVGDGGLEIQRATHREAATHTHASRTAVSPDVTPPHTPEVYAQRKPADAAADIVATAVNTPAPAQPRDEAARPPPPPTAEMTEEATSSLLRRMGYAQRSLRGSRRLRCAQSGLTDADCALLASMLTPEHRLTQLELTGNYIAAKGLQTILAKLFKTCASHLTELRLAENPVGAGVAVFGELLLRGPSYFDTPMIDLCDGEHVSSALGDAKSLLPRLEELDLRFCSIPDVSGVVLAQAFAGGSVPRLATLRLSGNSLGDAFCDEIAAALPALPQLRVLELGDGVGGNRVTSEGCSAIASAMGPPSDSAPSLECLDLSNNAVGDSGALSLASALRAGSAPRLRTLSVCANMIGEEAVSGLRAAAAHRSDVRLIAALQLCRPLRSRCTDPETSASMLTGISRSSDVQVEITS